MNKLENSKVVVIGQTKIKVSDVLPGLVQLPANSIVSYFSNLGLMFPRKIRIEALKESFTPYVNSEEEMEKLSDEMNYRLRWFETYSEAQLVNLFSSFSQEELFENYKEHLWLEIFNYMLEKQVNEKNFSRLFDLANNLINSPVLEKIDGIEYNDILNPLFFDDENMIDGLVPEIFRPVLYKCSTLDEVRDIGKKYGVNVPRRLRKKELVEIIKEELEDRNELTDELSEKIDKMTVIPLQRFAINNNIKVSIELKKEEIIEYILKNAHQTKGIYFKPQTGSYEVYDEEDFDFLNVTPIKEEVTEPEPVPEEVIEPEEEPEPEQIISPVPELEQEVEPEEEPEPELEPKIEPTESYVTIQAASKEEMDRVIREIQRVAKLVEELKDATYIMSDQTVDRLESKIDFSDKLGFEGNTREGVIKEPIMISPYQTKVSKKRWLELAKKKDNEYKRITKVKKQRPPVPVVIVNEAKGEEEL